VREFIFFRRYETVFFLKRGESKGMQNGEGEDCRASSCGGGAGKQVAQEQSGLDTAAEQICAEHICAQLRQLDEQYVVIVCSLWEWLALVRLMRMCVCRKRCAG
jgi:hypothetical protein